MQSAVLVHDRRTGGIAIDTPWCLDYTHVDGHFPGGVDPQIFKRETCPVACLRDELELTLRLGSWLRAKFYASKFHGNHLRYIGKT